MRSNQVQCVSEGKGRRKQSHGLISTNASGRRSTSRGGPRGGFRAALDLICSIGVSHRRRGVDGEHELAAFNRQAGLITHSGAVGVPRPSRSDGCDQVVDCTHSSMPIRIFVSGGEGPHGAAPRGAGGADPVRPGNGGRAAARGRAAEQRQQRQEKRRAPRQPQPPAQQPQHSGSRSSGRSRSRSSSRPNTEGAGSGGGCQCTKGGAVGAPSGAGVGAGQEVADHVLGTALEDTLVSDDVRASPVGAGSGARTANRPTEQPTANRSDPFLAPEP